MLKLSHIIPISTEFSIWFAALPEMFDMYLEQNLVYLAYLLEVTADHDSEAYI